MTFCHILRTLKIFIMFDFSFSKKQKEAEKKLAPLPIRELSCEQFNSIGFGIRTAREEVQSALDEYHQKEKTYFENKMKMYNS